MNWTEKERQDLWSMWFEGGGECRALCAEV